MDKSWAGTYRVIAVVDSSLILERAGKIPKWPKCKSRLIHDESLERFDTVCIDPDPTGNDTPGSSNSHVEHSANGYDWVEVKQDTLNQSAVINATGEESEMVLGDLDSSMFRAKDNYFHIQPENTTDCFTLITCPDHYVDSKEGMTPATSLYFLWAIIPR